jgi:hypothetical protein
MDYDFAEFEPFWQECVATLSQAGLDPSKVKGVASHFWKHAQAAAVYKILRAVGPLASAEVLDAIHKAAGMT